MATPFIHRGLASQLLHAGYVFIFDSVLKVRPVGSLAIATPLGGFTCVSHDSTAVGCAPHTPPPPRGHIELRLVLLLLRFCGPCLSSSFRYPAAIPRAPAQVCVGAFVRSCPVVGAVGRPRSPAPVCVPRAGGGPRGQCGTLSPPEPRQNPMLRLCTASPATREGRQGLPRRLDPLRPVGGEHPGADPEPTVRRVGGPKVWRALEGALGVRECEAPRRGGRARSVVATPPPPKGSIRIAVHHRRRGCYPPPPLQTKVTTVGKKEIYHWKNLIGAFLVHTLLGPRPPPSPSSNTSLPPPPHRAVGPLKAYAHCRCLDDDHRMRCHCGCRVGYVSRCSRTLMVFQYEVRPPSAVFSRSWCESGLIFGPDAARDLFPSSSQSVRPDDHLECFMSATHSAPRARPLSHSGCPNTDGC